MIVHHPNVLFRIVWIDGYEVRAFEDLVPLCPLFLDVAVGIHHGEAMFPLGVHSNGPLPQLRSVVRILATATCSWQRGDSRIAPRQPSDGKRQTRPEIGD